MLHKITFAVLVLWSISAFGQGRSRSVGSGGMFDASLSPVAVPGTTVSGTVTAVNGNIISLANGLVTIDASSAKITDDRGATATIAAVTPGTTIFAVLSTSTPAANAALTASVIAVRKNAQVTLTGPVQAVGTNSVTVLGRTITVDSNTSIGGHARSLSDILVNDIVLVEANAAGATLVAASILDFAPLPKPSTLIHGTVKTIGTDSWVITDNAGKDWTVLINAQTKIIGDPKVGDTVEILVNVDNANQYVAVSIMKEPSPPAKFTIFTGTVKSIGATQWVVHNNATDADVTVNVDSSTRIEGSPAVGDTVSVTLETDASGTHAVAIVKFGVPIPLNMTITGIVKSITRLAVTCPVPPNPCAVADWDIGPAAGMYGPDFLVLQTTATVINGNPQVGDRVKAVVQRSATSAMGTVAIEIDKL